MSPLDFVVDRTALFGKTRMGKANKIRVILDTMLSTVGNLGQIAFDLSGEYTYPDKQTGASIYLRYASQCSRYSLKPRHPEAEKKVGAPPPTVFRTNFYQQVDLGRAIIQGLFDTIHPRRPDYMAAFLPWEPVNAVDIAKTIPEEDTKRGCRKRAR